MKELLPGGADRHAKVILDLPGITVSVPSPHYRQAREKAGLSVSMTARSAQTSRAAIHAYETGAR